MKTKIIIAIAVLAAFPAAAMAGPVVGLGYTNIGLSGHAGRPGIQIDAGNLYHRNDVFAAGSATFARGYFGMDAAIGKIIQTHGTVSLEPYASLGFLNLNYNHGNANSVQDFYGLAGANLNIPMGSKIGLQFGAAVGHTITTFGGNSGAVYKGQAKLGIQVAPHVTANLNVSYLHAPGASLTSYGAGLAYHF